MRRACGSLTVGCGLANSSIRPSPMPGASGAASSPVSRGERKRGRRKNFLVLLGLDLVVDVPVIFSDKFQQSKSYMFLKAPQLQFIDRVVDIPVFRAETCTHSANCAVQRGDPTGAVLGQCLRLALVVSASVRFPNLSRSTPSLSCVCHRVWLGNENGFRRPSLEREVQWDVLVHSSSRGALCDVVHSPFGWFYHRCHCNCRDLVLFVVAMSCGGPDGAYNSIWDSVRPMAGKYTTYYFQYQECVGYVCMLNYWFSSNDVLCADNCNYSWFTLKDKCRSEKWEVYLYGDMIINSNDNICSDNCNYSWFTLKDKCCSEEWEVYLYGDMIISSNDDICPDNYNIPGSS